MGNEAGARYHFEQLGLRFCATSKSHLSHLSFDEVNSLLLKETYPSDGWSLYLYFGKPKASWDGKKLDSELRRDHDVVVSSCFHHDSVVIEMFTYHMSPQNRCEF